MEDRILYGKNQLKHIVAIEPEDNYAVIYQEHKGKIQSQIVDHNYWLMCSSQPAKDWKELKGDLFYKYGKKYDKFDDWLREKNILRRSGYSTYTINTHDEALMVKDGYTFFKDLNLKDVSCLAIDIEATGLSHDEESKVLLISTIYRSGLGQIEEKLFAYDQYNNEVELLKAFCKWVRDKDPSIILGYNITSYDLPYMNYCMERNGFGLELGRNNSNLTFENFTRKYRVDGNRELSYFRPKIYGRQIIDVYFLSLKYDIARNYDNYQLKYIIDYEGLADKDRVFYDASQIRFKYKDKEEWNKIIEYCRGDAKDVLKLYDLMAPPFFYMCNYVPRSFQHLVESASGSQINSMMVRSYLQEGHSIPRADNKVDYEGAISLGVPGIYGKSIRFDFASMYPNIMRQFKIYPKHKDVNANLLHIVNTLTEQRLHNKKLAKDTGDIYYKHLEQTAKIFCNSMYGLLGSTGLNFNYTQGANEITKIGRELLQQSIEWATGEQFNNWKEINKLNEEE